MGVNVEILRNLQAAEKAGNKKAVVLWQNQLNSLKVLEEAGLITQLPPIELSSGGQERLLENRPFTVKERKALIKDGAVILSPLGQTLSSQKESQSRLSKPSFRYVVPAEDGLLDKPSSLAQVAIYPDPKRFFVPQTGGKALAAQEALVAEDAEKTRVRTGLSTINEVIPNEAATLTGITFEYLKETGVWLFGPDYGYLYGRTKNPTTKSGSDVADVGLADPGYGLYVNDWYRDSGHDVIHAVRLVVPTLRTK